MLFGMVAALTAVSAWTHYSRVSDIVSGEATAIASVWRDLGGYPDEVREPARDILHGYTIRSSTGRGRSSGVARSRTRAWSGSTGCRRGCSPSSRRESQKIVHAETLRAFNELVQKRRQRLDAVRSGLPGVFWFMLVPAPWAVSCWRCSFTSKAPRSRPSCCSASPASSPWCCSSSLRSTPVPGRSRHHVGLLHSRARSPHGESASVASRPDPSVWSEVASRLEPSLPRRRSARPRRDDSQGRRAGSSPRDLRFAANC